MTLWMAVALLVLIAGMAFMTLWKPKDPWQADNLPPEGSSDQFRRKGIIDAAALHGITDASLHGDDPHEVYARLLGAVSKAKVLSAHNLAFHRSVLVYDMRRRGFDPSPLFSLDDYCTMEAGVDFTHLYGSCGTWKLPRLTELFGVLYFGLPGVRTTYREKVQNDIRLVAACLRRMNPTTPSLE